MRGIFWLAFVIVQFWVFCAIARALLSWFPLSYDSAFHRINRILIAITEPIVAPIRRLLPPAQVGTVGIDLSFLVVLLVAQILIIPFLARRAF